VIQFGVEISKKSLDKVWNIKKFCKIFWSKINHGIKPGVKTNVKIPR
jgi:hypothetical protein